MSVLDGGGFASLLARDFSIASCIIRSADLLELVSICGLGWMALGVSSAPFINNSSLLRSSMLLLLLLSSSSSSSSPNGPTTDGQQQQLLAKEGDQANALLLRRLDQYQARQNEKA
mmetsp:Transcript_19340/g.31263  ORF Transcript_19340/g.31263 Transcript_19340/m.31263 type:complete len:116 (+) Transcript_19340:641-988(+)